jgi:predicted nucleic acid-binding protein
MVDFLNGRENAVSLLSPLFEQGLAISIITYAELYQGVAVLPPGDARQTSFAALTESIDILGIDLETARIFGPLRTLLASSGQTIPDMDCLIAATALRHELTMVARDRHFDRIPDLKRQN